MFTERLKQTIAECLKDEKELSAVIDEIIMLNKKLTDSLHKKENELCQLECALEKKQELLLKKENDYQCQKQTLEELQKLFSEKSNNIFKLKHTLLETQTRLSEANNREIELKNNIESLKNLYDQLNEQHNQILSSKSWKYTQPFRKIIYRNRLLKEWIYIHRPSQRKLHKLLIAIKIVIHRPSVIFHFIAKCCHEGIKETFSSYNSIVNDIYDSKRFEKYKFSILMPVYNVDIKWLNKAIDSVLNQTFPNWELCIVDDASTDSKLKEYLKKISNPKIQIAYNGENLGISETTNKAASMSTGDYIFLMDNDDEIDSHALEKFAEYIFEKEPDLLYSDHDIIDEDNNHMSPLYKPDWSPDLFLSQNYLGHLVAFRRELYFEVGGSRKEYDGSQDYDLLLRMTERTDRIVHIPEILYSWRALPTSTSVNPQSKPYAQYAALKAIQGHLDRVLGLETARVEETDNLYVYDVRYPAYDKLASIIIPTKDHKDDLKKAIDSIIEKTEYHNYEIIVLNNNSEKDETYEFFNEIQNQHTNIKVINAMFDFNWSKLNNLGVKFAEGEVYVFLNNDIEIISGDWLGRLVENAIRKDVGVVGSLLLYPDGTIQHAGVVVGMMGWAEHVYKGTLPVHIGTPYISPQVTRNVMAITGACMAISAENYHRIGGFDEEFIICGSDVDFCLRAYESGLHNIYNPYIKLIHFESKTRDAKDVPEIDFQKSYKAYTPYREQGDPYYNPNLDYQSVVPKKARQQLESAVQTEKIIDVWVPEIRPIRFRKINRERKRLNILLPSINAAHFFGGATTAMYFFECMCKNWDGDRRLILVDADPDVAAIEKFSKEYTFLEPEEDSEISDQIVPMCNRHERTLAVSEKDYFIFTGWWTAYCIQEEYRKWIQKESWYPNMFVYLIQDYEPGFYAWSSLYAMALSTYQCEMPQIAVFNSKELKDYFGIHGYCFREQFVFNPVLNHGLKNYMASSSPQLEKKKQILVYGRPGTARNAFELLIDILRKWVEMQPNVHEWTVLSAGEWHETVNLGQSMFLRSVGKLSIEDYAKMLEETYAGVSLMISPHPSYPPLEMATFGVKVITNAYANKDLSEFSKNITSINGFNPDKFASALYDVTKRYTPKAIRDESNYEYCKGGSFNFCENIIELLLENQHEVIR